MLLQKYKLKNPTVEAVQFDGSKKMSDELSFTYYNSLEKTALVAHDNKKYIICKNDYIIYESDGDIVIMHELDFNLFYEKDDTQ